MNEAGWCDRISFMHQGKVLAQDKPQNLVKEKNVSNLEEALYRLLSAKLRTLMTQQKAPHQAPLIRRLTIMSTSPEEDKDKRQSH